MSVLERKFDPIERPYSLKELTLLRGRFYRSMRIGSVLIDHPECGHVYFAKANGKKEREALSSNMENLGSCSVCWKLNRTPKNLKQRAKDLVDIFTLMFRRPERDRYEDLELEQLYYTWLYREFNDTGDRQDRRPEHAR